MVVHGDVVLVGIGVQIPHTRTGHGPGIVQGIEVGLVKWSTVAHGITHPRHLHLDHLGPELSQIADGMRREDVHGGAHPPDALERLGLAELIARIELSLTVILIGHLHLIELFLALGARQILKSCFTWIFVILEFMHLI